MAKSSIHVIFICTGNSARSVLAECALNRLGEGRFVAHSAGSSPVGRVNPFAEALLRQEGYDTTSLRSKSWDEFSAPQAPALDYVFTVCANAAGETCPVWPGHPASAHWGLPDPAAVEGSDEQIAAAFETTLRRLETRIRAFIDLPLDTLSGDALAEALGAIAHIDTD